MSKRRSGSGPKGSDRIGGTGPHAGSKKRFWHKRILQDRDDESALRFQPHQFCSGLGKQKSADEALSPKAFHLMTGDKTLDWHVGKILYGIHEEVSK